MRIIAFRHKKRVSLQGQCSVTKWGMRAVGNFWNQCSYLLLALLLTLVPAHADVTGNSYQMRRVADIFDPLSRPAEMIHHSAMVVLLITAGIFLVVTFLLVYIVVKFRRRKDDDGDEPPQIYGSSHIELAWTVLPILITVVLILVASRTIGEIQNMPMPENALKVRLVGHQWWWEIHYPDLGIVTANEIHIPVSSRDRDKARPTHITLQSADVIHSFWVPQLAGKTDLVPNKDNETWVDPYEVGVYFGNCAEYCGSQHANMLLRVIVHEPEDFDRWVAQQKAPIVAPQTELETKGRDLFFNTSCVNCHRVDGTLSAGVFGPDLTKLMLRQTIGAGVAPLTKENLWQWVKDPQSLKVECLMPDMQLEKNEVDAIVAYLMTLK